MSFGANYKYLIKNGVRCLVLGFMYSGKNVYPNTKVLSNNEVFTSQWFMMMMDEYALKTDLVLLTVHDGTNKSTTMNFY